MNNSQNQTNLFGNAISIEKLEERLEMAVTTEAAVTCYIPIII